MHRDSVGRILLEKACRPVDHITVDVVNLKLFKGCPQRRLRIREPVHPQLCDDKEILSLDAIRLSCLRLSDDSLDRLADELFVLVHLSAVK